MAKLRKQSGFADEVVIYHSEDDGCWIAHSLRTDQLGTGPRIVDALADVLRAVHLIQAEAIKDGSLAVFREAPEEIQAMLKTAKKLPMEIFEVAHKMVHGEWPMDWNPPEPKTPESFHASVSDLACA